MNTLSPQHRAYLNQAAVTDAVIDSAGVHSRGSSIVFPWRWEGTQVEQIRPDDPSDPDRKYVWTAGQPLILNMIRPRGTGPVLLVEGTKQSLAVASWAPAEYTVVGMAGCNGWAKSDLSVFENRDVYIVLDADAAENPDVYTAGARLAEALDLEDARPSFVRLPVAGKEGADDYLAALAEDKRTSRLAKLISRSKTKPADRKPTGKPKVPSQTGLPDTGGRPGVATNLDRRDVIHKLVEALRERLDGVDLFNFGGALTILKGASTAPLDSASFLNLIAETVACFHYAEPTDRKPAVFTPSWPDTQTVQAVMSRADDFSPLSRIVRTPFVRPDGTVCTKAGYDEETRTVVVLGPGMDRVRVADEPTQDDARRAAATIMGDWLGDMPFKTRSDSANVLALILTPFIRGSVPLAPLCIVSGLQMGVGKNLLADCVSIVALGEPATPLPYVDDEDEIRKQITATFRTGSSFFVFDEAHEIESKQFSRALTARTYTDRVLGVSRMVEFPNEVTWLALGNQVQVNADMSRRVYYVALHPKEANPQDRDSSSFRHADLTEWTRQNRPELVSAALTMVRAWFAAGSPRWSRGSTMGSFGEWDRMMSGILAYAGVEGFLDDLVERRSESDFTAMTMAAHLLWLHGEFGSAEFTTGQVRSAAGASVDWEAPPGMEDTTPKDWTRRLGKQYARISERWYTVGDQRVRVLKAGRGHASTLKWAVESSSQGFGPVSIADVPSDGGPSGSGMSSGDDTAPRPDVSESVPVSIADAPEDDGSSESVTPDGRWREVTEVTHQALHVTGTHSFSLPASNPHVCVPAYGAASEVTSVTSVTSMIKGSAGQEQNGPTEPTQIIRYARGNGTNMDTPKETSKIGFDIETHSADELWTSKPGSFVRIVGAGETGNVTVTPETGLCGSLTASGTLVGHNLGLFDLIAADRHLGIPVEDTVPRMHDLRLVAFQADPPSSDQTDDGPGFKHYSLDALAHRYLDGAKSTDGKALAQEYGGWGNIPVDEPRYAEYCRDDVELALRIAEKLPMTDYDRREAIVASVTARATLEGFRVDVDAVTQRARELSEQSSAGRQMLSDVYGFPVLNGSGKPAKAPQRTTKGKQAFQAALESLGFPTARWKRNKDGSLSLAKDTLTAALEWATERRHPALDMIRTVSEMNGIRSNAANLLRYTVDGRVHPSFEPFQATGRWSVKEPGLTVLKKKGADSERAFLLPEEGHVLVSVDLDQIDIRCVAAHSQDPNLLAILNNPDRDIHSEVSVMAFGDAGGDHRHFAKSLDLGWLYGRTVNGLSKTPGITRSAAERVDSSMRTQFGRVMDWQNEVRDRATSGALLDNGFGRRLRVQPGHEFTQAPAMMGQSATRDLIAEGLIDLRRTAPEMLPMLRVIVHDEVVASVPEKDAEECARILQSCMSREWAPAGASNPVRITAGQGKPFTFGRNWLECYS